MKEHAKQRQIRVKPAMWAWWTAGARQLSVTRSELIRRAVNAYLEARGIQPRK